VLSVSLSPPQVSARFYIYHDFATITLAYSIHDATEEVTRKKMIEANQRERSIERKIKCMKERSVGVNFFSMPSSLLAPVSNLDYPNNFCS
jgi:hypothetical protein